jgi:hypothetical protein
MGFNFQQGQHMSDDKKFRLINAKTGGVRRSDEQELQISFMSLYVRAKDSEGNAISKDRAAALTRKAIDAVKAASPEACEFNEFTSVAYR